MTLELSPYETRALDQDDPAYVSPDGFDESLEDEYPDLADLIKGQARLVQTLQSKAKRGLDTKELKEIATAVSGLVTNIHRTGEMLKTIETHRLFSSVVLAFLRDRSDSLGEDLHAELLAVADRMNARSDVERVVKRAATSGSRSAARAGTSFEDTPLQEGIK